MKNRMKILKRLALIFFACLFTFSPAKAQYTGDMIENLNKKLGVRLPAEYESTIKGFLSDKVYNSKFSTDFIEQFIVGQMKQDWKIDKQNQLLFMWSSIYEQFTKKELFDIDDLNEKQLKDYEDCLETLVSAGEQFNQEFTVSANKFMEESKQRTEESKQRTEESKQRTEESKQRTEDSKLKTIEYIKKSLNLIKEFYYSYQQLPDEDDLNVYKTNLKELIPRCKEYNIDYKTILTPEMLKFYGVE